jgi:hypothetical protein
MSPLLVSSVDVEGVLLLLKIGFVVLLYLFIWRIVRTASKDLRVPQESFILAPQEAAAAGLRGRRPPEPMVGRLIVLKSPALDERTEFVLNSKGVTIGRSAQNDVALDDDEFASASHARVQPRQDGVWLEDVGSTNGTFLNGVKVSRPRKLTPGDLVRVGETDLRYDA